MDTWEGERGEGRGERGEGEERRRETRGECAGYLRTLTWLYTVMLKSVCLPPAGKALMLSCFVFTTAKRALIFLKN